LSFKAFLNVVFTGCNRAVYFLESAMHAVNFFFVSMEIGAGWKALDCSATIYNALNIHPCVAGRPPCRDTTNSSQYNKANNKLEV
jgi:hypothetical protein